MDRTGIEIGALRAFKAVADIGSVTAAAKRLSYVQSNVTARVRRLEAIVGAPLFHRQRRGMVLTPAGETLLVYANRVLGLVDEACQAVAETVGEGAALRIGSLESTAAVRLPSVLAALHRQHPTLQIFVATGPTDPLLQDVLACRLDGAFVGAKIDHPDIAVVPVFAEELGVIVARRAPPATRAGSPALVVFRQGCPYRAQAERWLRGKGLIPYRMMELGTLDGILGCVAAGMGIAVLPRSVIDRPHYREALSFDPLPPSLGRIRTLFIRRRDAPVLMGMRWFLEALTSKALRQAGGRRGA